MNARIACLLVPALMLTAPARAECTPDDVGVRITRTTWVDTCKDQPCPVLRGTAVIENRCSEAVGVGVQLRALDRDGGTVVVSEMWPFGRRNVPPGTHEISLDHWIGHDPEITSFSLTVTGLRYW